MQILNKFYLQVTATTACLSLFFPYLLPAVGALPTAPIPTGFQNPPGFVPQVFHPNSNSYLAVPNAARYHGVTQNLASSKAQYPGTSGAYLNVPSSHQDVDPTSIRRSKTSLPPPAPPSH
ncbi:hypothetical protein C8Q75DRAFT_811918 [Abortiporus biennis]|nr:hypothetical protein C8Q75DRAFT_811918 [Abortiporus biennis]